MGSGRGAHETCGFLLEVLKGSEGVDPCTNRYISYSLNSLKGGGRLYKVLYRGLSYGLLQRILGV